MEFREHLGQFLGDAADPAEVRDLALATVSKHVRRLKLAIAERLWLARELSGQDEVAASTAQLNAARILKARCDAAIAEHGRLSADSIGAPGPAGPDFRIVPVESAPAGSGSTGEAS